MLNVPFTTLFLGHKIDKARHEILKKIADVTRQDTVLKGLHLHLKLNILPKKNKTKQETL